VSEIALSPSTKLTPTGLAIGAELDFNEWENVGYLLGKVRDATAFALGDWLLWGEGMFGEEAAQAVEATGRSKATLLEYVRVSRQVQPSRRRRSLTWSHHQAVAARTPDEQERLLGLAEEHAWNREEFRGTLQADTPSRLGEGEGPFAGEVVELVVNIGRAILRAATPGERGQATVPADLLDRLANALGMEWPP
jgi:hypothetical protein